MSSVNDVVWPSYESSLYMEKRLKEKSFSYPYKHLAFPNISHAMFTELSIIYKLAFQSERKNATQCSNERKQLANELLNWIENVWN